MSKVNRLSDEALRQIEAFVTPGSLLKVARLRLGLSEREVADRLKIVPEYVGLLERDDYDSLRSPAFARGYIKSYGRLLGIDQAQLDSAYLELMAPGDLRRRGVRSQPLQLQRTGLGVAVGLGVLSVLVVALWWWRADVAAPAWTEVPEPVSGPVSASAAQLQGSAP